MDPSVQQVPIVSKTEIHYPKLYKSHSFWVLSF